MLRQLILIAILLTVIPSVGLAGSVEDNGLTIEVLEDVRPSYTDGRSVLHLRITADQDMAILKIPFSVKSIEKFMIGEDIIDRLPHDDRPFLVDLSRQDVVNTLWDFSARENIVRNVTDTSVRVTFSYEATAEVYIPMQANQPRDFLLVVVPNQRVFNVAPKGITWEDASGEHPGGNSLWLNSTTSPTQSNVLTTGIRR